MLVAKIEINYWKIISRIFEKGEVPSNFREILIK